MTKDEFALFLPRQDFGLRCTGRAFGREGEKPHGGVRPFHQKSTCLTQLTLVPKVVQIWSRNTLELGGSETFVLHRVGGGLIQTTSPQSGSKSSFSVALICATRRRIPASSSTNQATENGDLMPQRAAVVSGGLIWTEG